MKTKQLLIYSMAIIGLLLTFIFGCEKDIDFEGGRGTQDDPYLIATPEQLGGVRHNLNKHFRQIADIDLSGYSSGKGWNPIGADYRNPFTGTFNGNGYKITNLTINLPKLAGLFGYTNGSTIKNVSLLNISITGMERIGGLVGENYGNIINGYATGYVSGEGWSIGGLVGYNYEGGDIKNSYATVDVSGDSYLGGLAGVNQGDITNSYAIGDVSGGSYLGGLVGVNQGDITNSYATGDVSGMERIGGLVGENYGNIINGYATGHVSGEGWSIGGVVGYNIEGGDIKNSYATGDVSGYSYSGGLVGGNVGDITNSYATGDVSGNEYVGGFVGRSMGNIKNCYSTGVVSGEHNVGGFVGENMDWDIKGNIEYSYYDKETTGQDDTGKGIPKTTAEMMQQSTFETWDFTNIWRINEGNSYPYLRWQE